ncbi:MAG: hypothetical protein PHF21_02670 [Bacilli bacterium]|nr:hypothetical protein [Bacilli bacterium]
MNDQDDTIDVAISILNTLVESQKEAYKGYEQHSDIKYIEETIENLFILKNKEVHFCYECNYSGQCNMENAWKQLSFEYGECDDDCHFLNPFACNKSKLKE